LLAQNFPGAQIMAVDLSPDQLLNARNYCAGCKNITFQAYDFYSDEALPGEDYDCALAIEVFLHHPQRVLRTVLGRLLAVSRSVVSIDWSEHWPWKTPAHVWVHDYALLYAQLGCKCAAFALPEKVDGKQQRLFIGGRELSPEVTGLERTLRDHQTASTNHLSSGAGAPPAPLNRHSLETPSRNNSDAALPELEVTRQEMMRLVPPGDSFIFVNEDQ